MLNLPKLKKLFKNCNKLETIETTKTQTVNCGNLKQITIFDSKKARNNEKNGTIPVKTLVDLWDR